MSWMCAEARLGGEKSSTMGKPPQVGQIARDKDPSWPGRRSCEAPLTNDAAKKVAVTRLLRHASRNLESVRSCVDRLLCLYRGKGTDGPFLNVRVDTELGCRMLRVPPSANQAGEDWGSVEMKSQCWW